MAAGIDLRSLLAKIEKDNLEVLSLPETQVWWVKVLLSWVETRERDRDRTIVMTLQRSLTQYHRTGQGQAVAVAVALIGSFCQPPVSQYHSKTTLDADRAPGERQTSNCFNQSTSKERSDEGHSDVG